MEHSESDIKKIVLSKIEKCLSCGATCSLDNLSIIGKQGDFWLLVIVCPKCKSHAIVAVGTEYRKEDLDTSLEKDPIIEKTPLTTSDVQKMSCFLEKFDGDFISLFRKNSENLD